MPLNLQTFRDLSARLDPVRQALADLALAADLLEQADRARTEILIQTETLKSTLQTLQTQIDQLRGVRDQAQRTCTLEKVTYDKLLADSVAAFQAQKKLL